MSILHRKLSVTTAVMSRRAEVELESARESSATAATAATRKELEGMTAGEASAGEAALLEELRKWMCAALLERVPSLLRHGVVRVVAVVEARTQLGVR